MRFTGQNEQTPTSTSHTIGLWVPFVATMLLLVALVVLPIVFVLAMRRARTSVSDVIDPARLALSTFEASFGTELYLSTIPLRSIDTTIANRYRAAIANEARSAGNLRRLLRDIAPLDSEVRSVLAAADAWHAARQVSLRRSSSSTLDEQLLGIATLATADRLDDNLNDRAREMRERISDFERLAIVLSSALVILTAVGVAFLAWAGIRTARLATLAQAQRRALVEANDARDKLLRQVSHDLRNPLSVVVTTHELLEQGYFGKLNEQQAEVVKRAQRQTRLAVQTATDFLDVAQREARNPPAQQSLIRLDDLVNEMVLDHADSAARHGLTLKSDTEAGRAGGATLTDPDRVRHVVTNLISNAIKYATRGGRVVVRAANRAHGSTFAPEARLTIEVADTGPGIPSQDRERIFQESIRLQNAENIPGNGIGLTSSRRIARALDGDLTVEANSDGGSTFILWLPLRNPG